ncbi:NAD(P)H-dependent glycerol-3-phosphate dehydrogenase [Hydrotalea sandarakina]|uniref:Glycerol-3-phosphate dehydrogenase n=1 Tax=Hydrotalea sandarakina TaxID=1004304 RepID=A0A2W7RN11_9BACT|nr:NAD(P)H-dependent glycerol-3-phosphate dehydrogenase [Hydrotalea sandarakina]PZX62223.1 glycerol-3-phosphate dehydrogenase (NAD(P)+) [Hydrotalea sandarakina]
MQIGIIGSGSWATAIAKILTDNEHHINWWIRNEKTIPYIQQRKHNPHYLSNAYFNTQLLNMSASIQTVIEDSDVIVVAIPSAYVADAFHHLPKTIFKNKYIISAIKGILPHHKYLFHEYLQEHFQFPLQQYFTLLGPCHAEEVAAEKLSYLTFSGMDKNVTQQLASYFKTPYINTETNTDVIGVQYAAVLKNIYALGAGIAHGLEYGDNFLSVYIANCALEMNRFLKAITHKETDKTDDNDYAASVYLGDLLVTCYSLFSRNRTFGNMIGKGYSVKAAQLELNMVAEGYNASKCMVFINQQYHTALPIVQTIYEILWEHFPADEGFQKIEALLV